jgi:outer membrane protein TolC
VVFAAGCQSYSPAPLDLDSHHSAFLARSIDGEPLAEFADRLRDAGDAAPAVFDPADGLTAAEGEVLALFFNADLRMLRARAGVAVAAFETAGLWDDPVFGFNGAEILSSGGTFDYGLIANFTIPISGRLAIEKDRARAAVDVERRRIVDAEWTLRTDVRRSWSAWTLASERLALADDILVHVEEISALTNRLEEAGELSRVQGRLLRIEAISRRSLQLRAVLDERRARLKLLRLLGLSPDVKIELVPGVPDDGDATPDDALARIIRCNTRLDVHRAEYQVVEDTLRLEIRKQFPDMTIGTGYGSEGNDDRLLLGFSMPIPILNANQASVAEARAKRDVARITAETTYEQLVHEFAEARSARDAVREQRIAFETTMIPMLDEQDREITRIAELGEIDTFLLLETVTRQFDARSQLLDLQRAEADAALTITQLLGPDTMREPADIAPAVTVTTEGAS